MPTATMTSKGQLTVPAEVRNQMGLVTGSRVDFVESGGGWHIEARRLHASRLFGVLPKPAIPMTLEQMEAGIAQGAATSMGGQ